MIKKLSALGLVLLVVLWSGVVFADTRVTATWDPNPEPDVAGYKVYDNGQEIASTLVGTETVTFISPDGDHSYTLTCLDESDNESIPTLPILRTYDTAAPGQPGGFLFTDEITIP